MVLQLCVRCNFNSSWSGSGVATAASHKLPYHTLCPAALQVDPLDDIDVINLELALADLSQIEKRMERLKKGEPLGPRISRELAVWAVGRGAPPKRHSMER